jgi:hypothetical protein
MLEKDLIINNQFEDYSMYYKVIFLETVDGDIKQLYTKELETHRTVLIFDSSVDLSYVYAQIELYTADIHAARGKSQTIAEIFPHAYLHTSAYTSMYWSDVRYFANDNTNGIIDEVYLFHTLNLEVLKLMKQHYYDRDILADTCLKSNPSNDDIEKAIKILNKKDIDVDVISHLFSHQKDIDQHYEKIVLNEKLLDELSGKSKVKTSKI